MTERPDCRVPDACKSVGFGKHCRSCALTAMNLRKEHRAKAGATRAKTMADPVVHARFKAAIDRSIVARMADPATRAILSENGRKYGAMNIAATRTDEVRAKAGKAISAAHNKHIPEHLRDRYRQLMAMKKFTASEALGLAQLEEKQRLAKLTPFERQLEDVRAGRVKMVERFIPPIREPDFTLGGVASSWAV